jgi:hypothetical protein
MLAEALPLGSGLVLRQFAWQADVLILMWLVDANALACLADHTESCLDCGWFPWHLPCRFTPQ